MQLLDFARRFILAYIANGFKYTDLLSDQKA